MGVCVCGCVFCVCVCVCYCSLHDLFLQATPVFPHGVTIQGGTEQTGLFNLSTEFMKNLHKIAPLMFVAHREIRRQRRNVHLNILR